MEKYYYQTEENGVNCVEECSYSNVENVHEKVKVGSMACKQCENNIAYDGNEGWIKCEVYSAFAEVEKLTEENEQLKAKIQQLENDCKK